jgi:hypothetical protein
MESNTIQNIADRNQVIITEEEVERALEFSKRNKAQGPRGVPINYAIWRKKCYNLT